jgi:hypothetical protein
LGVFLGPTGPLLGAKGKGPPEEPQTTSGRHLGKSQWI